MFYRYIPEESADYIPVNCTCNIYLRSLRSILVLFPFLFLFSCAHSSTHQNERLRIETFYVSHESISFHDSIRITVVLPHSYKESGLAYPSLYLLPGYNQNDSIIYEMGIDSLLNVRFNGDGVREFVLVTLNSNNDSYTNWVEKGRRWRDFISKDLIMLIESRYRIISDSSMRGIYGFSMGGQGALEIAVRNPDIFGIALSHSASLHFDDMEQVFEWAKPYLYSSFEPVYGKPLSPLKWRKNNFLWQIKNDFYNDFPKIYFDVGVNDHLGFHRTNIELNKLLTERHIPHMFSLHDEGHGTKAYRNNMTRALDYYNDAIIRFK